MACKQNEVELHELPLGNACLLAKYMFDSAAHDWHTGIQQGPACWYFMT